VLASYRKDFTFEDILYSSELALQEKVDFCHFLIAGGQVRRWILWSAVLRTRCA